MSNLVFPPSPFLDGNGRPIAFPAWDPANHQWIIPQAGPGVADSQQPGILLAPLANAQIDGFKASYSIGVGGLVAAASCTDLFTLTGIAGKTIRITRCDVSGGIATTAQQIEVYGLVRSTANTGGTSTTPTPVPYDSTDGAAGAVARAYTANPSSLGTLVGNVRVAKMLLAVTGGTTVQDRLVWDFGDRPTKALVLRGAQVFAINLNAVSLTSSSFNIYIEWTEDTYS